MYFDDINLNRNLSSTQITQNNTELQSNQTNESNNFDKSAHKEVSELNQLLRQKDELIMSLQKEIKIKNDKIQEMSETILKIKESNVKELLQKSVSDYAALNNKVERISRNLNSTFASNNNDFEELEYDNRKRDRSRSTANLQKRNKYQNK